MWPSGIMYKENNNGLRQLPCDLVTAVMPDTWSPRLTDLSASAVVRSAPLTGSQRPTSFSMIDRNVRINSFFDILKTLLCVLINSFYNSILFIFFYKVILFLIKYILNIACFVMWKTNTLTRSAWLKTLLSSCIEVLGESTASCHCSWNNRKEINVKSGGQSCNCWSTKGNKDDE